MLKFKISETYSRTDRRMTGRRSWQTIHCEWSMSHVTMIVKLEVLSKKKKRWKSAIRIEIWMFWTGRDKLDSLFVTCISSFMFAFDSFLTWPMVPLKQKPENGNYFTLAMWRSWFSITDGLESTDQIIRLSNFTDIYEWHLNMNNGNHFVLKVIIVVLIKIKKHRFWLKYNRKIEATTWCRHTSKFISELSFSDVQNGYCT